MNDHFSPVANPAPPRPRCPDALTSLMMASRPRASISFVPSQAPRRRAPSRPQSCWPYKFLKMRSLLASINSVSLASHLHLTCISLASHLHLTCISLASHLHLTCISLASHLH